MNKKFWNWVKDEEGRTLYFDGYIAQDSWFDEEVTDGFIFDKVTVTNALMRKIPKVKETQPVENIGVPHDQLLKRLELLKY